MFGIRKKGKTETDVIVLQELSMDIQEYNP